MIDGARRGGVIAIRVDAGGNFGLGHLSRSLAIAGELSKSGSQPFLVTRSRIAAERARARDLLVDMVDQQEDEASALRRAAQSHGVRLLVVDNKAVSGEDIKRAGVPAVVIDPILPQLGAAALAVVPTAHSDEAFLVQARKLAGRVESGAPFAIVRNEILAVGPREPRGGDVPVLVVTTGGTDPAGVLLRLLPEIAQLPEAVCLLRILRGPGFLQADRLDAELAKFQRAVEVLIDDVRFPGALAEADVVLCTFGVTPYELAYLGIPTVLVSHSEENAEGAARFSRHGSALDLGHVEALMPGALSGALRSLLSDKARQAQMRHEGRALIDGRGAERVAGCICRELEGALAAL